MGGVGGSGTRVLAALLQALGFHIGEDLNGSLDNLWFTALFKRRRAYFADDSELARLYEVFRAASSGRPPAVPPDLHEVEAAMLEPRDQHPVEWLRERAASLIARLADPRDHPRWAWKEPSAHLFARSVLALDSELRYIHLARNGLDMAFSSNQNQLRFWGDLALPPALSGEPEPARSLRYWCWVEGRAQGLREDYPGRVLWLRFEDLCARTDREGEMIARFLGCPVDPVVRGLERLVETPSGVGRFRRVDGGGFHPEDVAFVASLGFPVD